MDENFVICPFNKSHIISRLRIQYHLVKCKKNYPNSKKIVCPYDATEYIDPGNFMQHLSQCKKHRKLDVTEEYKRKQFESLQHGRFDNHRYDMPVEVTNEWNSENTSDDFQLTADERLSLKLRQQSKIAVHRACQYIPLITQQMGRGKSLDAYQQYLNRYEPPEMPINLNAPIILADECESNSKGIYEDADETENSVSLQSVPCSSEKSNSNHTSLANNNENVVSSSCYKPSIGRGLGITKSAVGRGISIGRGITLDTYNTISSHSDSFDEALKQIVENIMSKNQMTLEESKQQKEINQNLEANGKKMENDLSNKVFSEENSSKNRKSDNCKVVNLGDTNDSCGLLRKSPPGTKSSAGRGQFLRLLNEA